MIAGATGIDLFLLVIDAQEGARPQTLEHLAVLRLLGVEHGVVAVTKADAVDDGDARARAGGGARAGARAPRWSQCRRRPAPGSTSCARRSRALPVDRAGSRPVRRASTSTASSRLRGVGTVATGTLWAGAIAAGDELRVEPAGRTVRVRSVQVHDAAVEQAEAGQRVAVNLPRPRAARPRARRRARRARATIAPSYRLDVRLTSSTTCAGGGDGARRNERRAARGRSRRRVRAAPARRARSSRRAATA